MFGIGSKLGELGSWGLIGAALVLVLDQARHRDVVGLAASAVLVLGARHLLAAQPHPIAGKSDGFAFVKIS